MAYDAVLFDLDDTLLDFRQAEENAFAAAHAASGLSGPVDVARARYQQINRRLWDDFGAGLVTKEHVVRERFRLLLDEFGSEGGRCDEINTVFLSTLSDQGCALDDCHSVLETLRHSVRLGIVTNGVHAVQLRRIERAEIGSFFEVIVTSEEAGVGKPHAEIFEYALSRMGVAASAALYVGDHPHADMVGALGAGLDACWFNPSGVPFPHDNCHPTMMIRRLSELPRLL
jgi:2-haloacid dehalogenase